jgi:hypothetical protein
LVQPADRVWKGIVGGGIKAGGTKFVHQLPEDGGFSGLPGPSKYLDPGAQVRAQTLKNEFELGPTISGRSLLHLNIILDISQKNLQYFLLKILVLPQTS